MGHLRSVWSDVSVRWCLTLFLFALLSSVSGLDLWLERQFYDVPHHIFSYRDDPWLVTWLHDGLKKLVAGLWLLLAALLIIRSLRRRVAFRSDALAYVVLASGVSALLVSVLKQASLHSCPWDLFEFGGSGRFFTLIDHYPVWPGGQSAAGPGKCFPSGHAASGWMWLCVLFVNKRSGASESGPWQWRGLWQGLWISLVLVTGFVSSAVQIIRGAHFLSHVLATALVCLVVARFMRLALRDDSQPAGVIPGQ